jgi:chromosome partitioning protein
MILSFSNQKGGVGKTTTTLNIGVYLAKQNKRVLLVDLDPQANLTSGLGYSIRQLENSDSEIDFSSQNDTKKKKSIYEVLIGESNIEETYISTRIENLFIVPSCIELAGAEIDLVSMMNREGLLKKALKNVKSQFDFILIDCPPSLGLITINALTASDKVIVPVQCEYYALEGLGQLLDTIKLVKNNLNSSLDVGGIILTMYDSRTKLSEQVVAEVRNYFKGKAFDTIIPRNIRLSESPSHGLSISEYEPSSTGAKSYEKLAIEFLERFDIN